MPRATIKLKPVRVREFKRLGRILECRNCRGREFEYVEDISCGRSIIGFNESGILQIDGFYRTEGYDEGGENGRLCCRGCGDCFEPPEGIEFT